MSAGRQQLVEKFAKELEVRGVMMLVFDLKEARCGLWSLIVVVSSKAFRTALAKYTL